MKQRRSREGPENTIPTELLEGIAGTAACPVLLVCLRQRLGSTVGPPQHTGAQVVCTACVRSCRSNRLGVRPYAQPPAVQSICRSATCDLHCMLSGSGASLRGGGTCMFTRNLPVANTLVVWSCGQSMHAYAMHAPEAATASMCTRWRHQLGIPDQLCGRCRSTCGMLLCGAWRSLPGSILLLAAAFCWLACAADLQPLHAHC